MNHYIILTEGNQDVSVISKLLEINSYKEIKTTTELEKISPIFFKLLPNSFPFYNNKFKVWNIIPQFYKKEENVVLIITPEGQDNILNRIKDYFNELELEEIEKLNKILIVLDADECSTPQEKIDSFYREFEDIKILKNNYINMELRKIFKIGDIEESINIPLSIYVLPNNRLCGTLEDLLVETIKFNNEELYSAFENFLEVNHIKFAKEADRQKALISCVGGVLVPKGYSTAMNIKDKKVEWISKKSLDLPCLKTFNDFFQKEIN